MYTVLKTMLMAVSLMASANGNEPFLMMDTPPMDIPDFRDIPLPGMGDRAMMALSAMGGSKLDDLSQFVPMMSMWKSTLTEGATSMFDSAISKIKSAYHSYSSSATAKRWRSIFSDLTSRYLGWNNGGDSYDGSRSQYVQDALDAKTAYFWFITAFSNSFAVGFGLKAALQGVHPKFHFSATMARSMAFHIVIGSIEFVWVVIMYLSVPQWWHSVVLVVLDSIQNVTIWIQMANSQGVKLVTNSCYLFCLVVKAAMCCGLVLIDPFSRDLVWGIYEILSAFTLTRISGMSFKKLGLFKGQMYTLAVFTATLLSSAQAFGHFGPCALYLFLCGYSAVHQQPRQRVKAKKAHRRSSSSENKKDGNEQSNEPVSWSEEARRNPFGDEQSMTLVRSLVKEGDQQRASKQERARIVFQVITGESTAQWMSQEQLAKVLCPSGVGMPEVVRSFNGLSTVNPLAIDDNNRRGIHFDTFFEALPTVWDWYFDYMYESVYAPERQIR